jgi:hypothetical protein
MKKIIDKAGLNEMEAKALHKKNMQKLSLSEGRKEQVG